MTKRQTRRDTRLNKLLIFYPRLLYTFLFTLKLTTCMDAEHNHGHSAPKAFRIFLSCEMKLGCS
jgi:hypothetical protein